MFRLARHLLHLIVSPVLNGGRYLIAGSWKRGLALLVTLALAAVVGGLMFAWLGLASVSARSGHWPVTEWFLHMAMRNAVETRSVSVKPPLTLDDPKLILKGAGHYETGCSSCHASPGKGQSLIVQQMTPMPPVLATRIKEWTPEELFWIVKNGVKFSAMPAWLAPEREDEIWAIVAFIRKLPELSSEQYEHLALGTSASGWRQNQEAGLLKGLDDPLGPTLANCVRCHGAKGEGRGPSTIPILAGQRERYLLESLEAYANGERKSGIMQPIAAALDDQTRRELARHYASLARPEPAARVSEQTEAIQRGETIAQYGVPRQGVPSCAHCHGPRQTPRNPIYPDLSGQHADYLTLQLELFKSQKRGGTAYVHLMHSAVRRLTPEQMSDLAAYYAAQTVEASQ
ncbi:cytochrome c553 [Pseudomonas duriflava]|uniref:Cytochrome c553 n=1 Tax=Pseudomonas duriflava TaxID=459528 RepID=A0A562PXY3_9PSED|nr:c-type cytochrome [Pseudomonas duriflava]TWI49253.1 cytochrome c553 [Pseudomonas duriflava]